MLIEALLTPLLLQKHFKLIAWIAPPARTSIFMIPLGPARCPEVIATITHWKARANAKNTSGNCEKQDQNHRQ